MTGIDIARKRAGLQELKDAKKHMKLNHNELEGVAIAVKEKEKLDSITTLAKYRPSQSKEVAKRILNNDMDYSKEFKYQKDELDNFSKKPKVFSYFYPDRESLEERYQRERLEKYPVSSTDYSQTKSTIGTSSSKFENTQEKYMRQEWNEMRLTKQL